VAAAPIPQDPGPEDHVLAVVVERALETGRRILDPLAAEAACAERGVDHDAWFAAVGALRRRGVVALQTAPPSQVVLLAATNSGVLAHARSTRPDLGAVVDRLGEAVRAVPTNHAVGLAEMVGEPALLVECLLDSWVTEGRIVYSLAPGRRFRIHRVLLDGSLPGPAASAPEPAS
jgi:hypothetical protein